MTPEQEAKLDRILSHKLDPAPVAAGVYVDFLTVEDETVTVGPFEKVVFDIGRGEIYAEGKQLMSYNDMFGYCDRVQYHDGTLRAITDVTVRSV